MDARRSNCARRLARPDFAALSAAAKAAASAAVVLLCLGDPADGAAQVSASAAAPRPPAELSAEQWRADLRFMADEMRRRHANLHHTVGREAFDAAIADLDRRIPSLQRNEIVVGMMRIAALVRDGHTRLDPRKDEAFGFRSLPLKLYLFEDGLYVRAARADHRNLIGARIEAIGGVPVDEALRRVSELASRDNDMGPRFYAPLYLNMPDILHALGLSDRRDAATFTLSRGGRTWRATAPAGEVEPRWPPDTDISLITPKGWLDARGTSAPPMWLAAPLDYHRLIELPERNAIYVQLNMVANIDGESLDQFGIRVRERAEAVNPRTVVLDLRLNSGGNGALRNRFVRELIKTEDADTRLAVLTWRGTFSASQFILNDLDRLTGAVFIGEPASSRPSHYGDSYRAVMPNSRISIRNSILRWQSEQNQHPWTWVDVSAPLTYADYAAGRDPALEAALAYAPPGPLDRRLAAAFAKGGKQALDEALQAFVLDPVNRYADVAGALLTATLGLNASGDGEAALAVARFAVERFPDNVFVATVLASTAEARGERELAVREARRGLALDPNNRFAQSLLDRNGAAAR